MEPDFSDPADQSREEGRSRSSRLCCFTSTSLNASSVLARGSERAFSRANVELGNAFGLKLKIHGSLRHRVFIMNVELDTQDQDCGQFLPFFCVMR